MKKYIFITLLISLLVLGVLSFGPKSGGKSLSLNNEKSIISTSSPKKYSEDILRSDLEEIKKSS